MDRKWLQIQEPLRRRRLYRQGSIRRNRINKLRWWNRMSCKWSLLVGISLLRPYRTAMSIWRRWCRPWSRTYSRSWPLLIVRRLRGIVRPVVRPRRWFLAFYYKKKSRVHKLKSSITSFPRCLANSTIPPLDFPLASSWNLSCWLSFGWHLGPSSSRRNQKANQDLDSWLVH